MWASNTLLALLAASSTTWAAQLPARADTQTAGGNAPKRYIVELKSRGYCPRAAEKVASFAGLRVVKQFDSDLFPAVSVECEHECDGDSIAAAIEAMDDSGPVVASVYTSSAVQLVMPIEGESFSDDAAAINYSVHGLTGVDKLHEAGLLGEGATVAIVDSGVQYTHPALGGGIGENFTVIGGYDLIDSDDDPMDGFGHGTHVAGIVAGKSDQFVGVAPSAKILSFRVLNNGGWSTEELVIEGFLDAFDSGADIISASVGETNGFTANAWAVVASRMVEQGVFVTIANGNDGQSGPFSMSNGGSGAKVLAVGSAEPGVFPAQAFTADFNLDGGSNATELAYIPGSDYFPNTVVDWPIEPLTLNSTVENDACEELPADTPNFNGTIVLVRVGGCSVYTKHTNLIPFNASYILFYNDDGPYVSAETGTSPGITGAIEAAAGEAIIEAILAGGNVTATFDIDTAHYVGLSNAGSGRPARYTSFGGTFDLALKPDIAAPGSKILSTYPTDGYQVLSGTSMATPYMAGIAALWVSKNGGRAAHADDPEWAQRLTSRMMSSARTVPWADWSTSATDYGFWAPTTQVGAGLIDAGRLMSYKTDLSFSGRKFELNDTAHFVGTHSVDIINSGSEAVTYTFSLQDAGGYEAWTPASDEAFTPAVKFYSDISPMEMTPDVVMPEGDFTVGPGETKTAEFTFTAPTGLNETNLPVYSGKILISGSNGEELGVPYFGVGCDLQETISTVWDIGLTYPRLTSTTDDIKVDQKSNFTFNFTRESQDFPHLSTQFSWGTAELRWDIFDANYTEELWSYPPVVGENGFVGLATSWSHTADSSWFIGGEDSEDDIFPFPVYNTPRKSQDAFFWLGRFANGSTVLPGSYSFRIAALRPLGDPTLAEDWDVFQTPQITILPLE